jgi:tight adherence protein C
MNDLSPLALAAVGTLSLALGLLVWAVMDPVGRARRRVVANLQRGLDSGATDADATTDGPGALGARVRRLTPPGTAGRLDGLLARAGRPPAWPLERLLAGKIVLAVVAVALGAAFVRAAPGTLAILVMVVGSVVAYFLPELLLHSRGQERSEQIGLELADTLDQMTIAVEAGLGFEAAMARAGKNGTGPLAEELVRTLQDMRMGLSRRAAYEQLARRTDVPDLRRFIRAVVQADAYGIAIADVLRTQAVEMRLKRRQRAEEKAMQIPVKVIFPLMFFILPVLFIVLLGPAVMDIVAAFS